MTTHYALFLSGLLVANLSLQAEESLPPLKDGKAPQTLDQLWAGYDPRKEPLAVEVTKEWEQDGVVCRVVRYRVGVFKGAPSTIAAFYGFPKSGTKLPALVQLHGGGQAANLDCVMTDAKRGYATISLNWGGNKLNFGRTPVTYDGPNTDWGKLDATHPPQRNKANHFAGALTPDEYTLDAIESPRNSNWFLVLVAARRAITFLEQQPEVDADRIGVYGHSMGGKLTTDLAGIDKRVKAAVPSCGGSGDVVEGDTDLPGFVKSKPSPLELACVSDNVYIPRITCPILYLGPMNDFAGILDNMYYRWRSIGAREVRYSITPHMNHHHEPAFAITQHLWFEQHLKGAFTMPVTPRIDLVLKTKSGIPEVAVTPDTALPIRSVDIYYTVDPHVLTRFWRDAGAVRQGDRWSAVCPILSLDQPLFVLANVIYELPPKYRSAAQTQGLAPTDVFGLSSEMRVVSPSTLREIGVKATDAWSRMIDDGSRGWHDWYRLLWGHPPLWQITTRKLKDPKWLGPDGAKLAFDVKCETDNTLVISLTCNGWGAVLPGKPPATYAAVKHLKGSPEWQALSVSLDEFARAKKDLPPELKKWAYATELRFSPSGTAMKDGKEEKIEGLAWQGERQVRRLRWEGGADGQTRSETNEAVNPEAFQRGFNDAIKQSLEQEKTR